MIQFTPTHALALTAFLLLGCGGADADTPEYDEAAGAAGAAQGGGGSVAKGGASGTGGAPGTGGKAGASGVGGGGAGAKTDAGSGGSAGSGGTEEAGPITVMPCSSLSAVGQWEKISPSGVTFTQDFVLDPLHPGTVYVGAAVFQGGSGGIYKTTDCGATWARVSTGAGEADINAGGKWTLVIDHIDPQILYTANGYGTMGVFKSTNGGVDFTQILPPDIAKVFVNGGFVERIVMDPTDRLHLTVTPHFSCESGHTKDCMLETFDGGATWRVLDNTPPGGEDTGQMMLDSKHWLYAASDWHMYQTLDGGASWQQVFTGWTTNQDPYKASNGSYYIAAESGGVVRSTDGLAWSSIPNSPQSIRAIIGDGTTLFTSNRRDCSPPCQPYMSAAESDPTKWTTYPSPPLPRGGWRLHYDVSHHIMYSSTETNGLWRVVTK